VKTLFTAESRAIAPAPSRKLREYGLEQNPGIKRLFTIYKAALSFPEGYAGLSAIALERIY